MEETISNETFHKVTDHILNLLLEIQESQKALTEKIIMLERRQRVTTGKIHENKIFIRRGWESCKDMLKAVQTSYHNVLKAQEHCLLENEDLIQDLSNSVSNSGPWS